VFAGIALPIRIFIVAGIVGLTAVLPWNKEHLSKEVDITVAPLVYLHETSKESLMLMVLPRLAAKRLFCKESPVVNSTKI
jgi:NAD(P)H-flavin reductase